MKTKTELKPCPFCNSNNLYETSNGIDSWFIECHDCGAAGPASFRGQDSWNTRASLEAPQVESEPVAWANGEQLALCKKMPLYDEPNNPMLHNIPRNIAGQSVQSGYCNTPLYDKPQVSITVLPERKPYVDGLLSVKQAKDSAYNQALDDVAKLNATPVPIELLRNVCATGLSYSERQALLDELRELTK